MSDQGKIALIREYKDSTDVGELMARYGAHGIGIGRKIVDGKVTDTLALRIYVEQKRAPSELEAYEVVPLKISFLPRNQKGRKPRLIDTDVIETPMARFEEIDPHDRIRPVPGGVSCGIRGRTGTLGGWVWDMTDDAIVMLSNHHVFLHTSGEDIRQPGGLDGGVIPDHKIGDVKRAIPRSTTATNIVDCAIGNPDNSEIYDLRVPEIGPAIFAIEAPVLGMMVEKFGRTTGHTFGEITDIDLTFTSTDRDTNQRFLFDDCIRVEPRAPSADWSDSGDSGSLVFSRTPIADGSDIKPVVGLHFSGGGTSGSACKIQNVFNELNLTTLCDGAFGSVSDSMFEAETESEEAEARFGELTALATCSATRFNPHTFVLKERYRVAFRGPYFGISREMQKRLRTSKRGRVITDFVDQNRAELLTLFAKDGDVRRATLAAIRPLVVSATTTTDVLERKITAEDLARLEKLGGELLRKGSPRLKEALKPLMALKPKEGLTLAKALEIVL